jgi:hypothetical protein
LKPSNWTTTSVSEEKRKSVADKNNAKAKQTKKDKTDEKQNRSHYWRADRGKLAGALIMTKLNAL